MSLPDSIQILTDSSKILTTDSIARLDSVTNADSIRLVDSLSHVAKVVRGFSGIPHPSLPQTESWVFITLSVLFFIFVFSISRSSALFSDTIKSFFQVKERSSIFSKATVNDFRFRLFIIIFSIGVISLFSYLLLHKTYTPYSFKDFSLFLAVTLTFFGIKSVVFDIMGYVFLDPITLKIGKESYFNIISFWGIILFPLMVIEIYLPFDMLNIITVTFVILCIIAYIIVTIKLFQIFFHKIVASFYIMLYLCTLEFLPLIALYKVYELIL